MARQLSPITSSELRIREFRKKTLSKMNLSESNYNVFLRAEFVSKDVRTCWLEFLIQNI